jgi:hypothetical protein
MYHTKDLNLGISSYTPKQAVTHGTDGTSTCKYRPNGAGIDLIPHQEAIQFEKINGNYDTLGWRFCNYV